MTIRGASILGFLSLSLMLASCAEGGGTDTGAAGSDGFGNVTGRCGDGMLDAPGESCECPVGSTEATCAVTTNDTCATLDPTTMGELLCDRVTCMYLPTACMPVGTSGTTGGGGAGGS